MKYGLFALLIIVDAFAWYEMYFLGGWLLVGSYTVIGIALITSLLWWMHRYPDVRRR